jgi:hypothetical protein
MSAPNEIINSQVMQNSELVQDQIPPRRNLWKWIITSEIAYFLLFGGGIIGFLVGQITAWVPSTYHREIALQPSQTPYIKLSPSPIAVEAKLC